MAATCKICWWCKCNWSCHCDATAIRKYYEESWEKDHLYHAEIAKIEEARQKIDYTQFKWMSFLDAVSSFKKITWAMYITIAEKNILLSNI